ncbi:hypothetical protein [Belnapia moabensis]|uniref:hypothetical protein n=1 Tax=Belnapia moabensis TaxID=365533 RepID=UPI001FDFD4DD|nr:hypothetical protein [Belnapia moabensis]
MQVGAADAAVSDPKYDLAQFGPGHWPLLNLQELVRRGEDGDFHGDDFPYAGPASSDGAAAPATSFAEQ